MPAPPPSAPPPPWRAPCRCCSCCSHHRAITYGGCRGRTGRCCSTWGWDAPCSPTSAGRWRCGGAAPRARAPSSSARAVPSLYGVPPLAVVIGALTLGESVTPWLALGTLLVVGGVAVAQVQR